MKKLNNAVQMLEKQWQVFKLIYIYVSQFSSMIYLQQSEWNIMFCGLGSDNYSAFVTFSFMYN
jgi:hypothetical protein